jgi:hypothetical protein
MKTTARALLLSATAIIASLAMANVTRMPPAMPSPSMGIEMDVSPVASQPGRFVLTATITDLEKQTLIGAPKLLIDSDRTARVETGGNDWMLEIAVAAGSTSKKATYDATFTREGKVISRQRFSVNLNS